MAVMGLSCDCHVLAVCLSCVCRATVMFLVVKVTPPQDGQLIPELPASHHELKADIQQVRVRGEGKW